MQVLPTTTDYWLVAASILTSIVASFAAFSFAERLAASTGRAYTLWLTSGAACMGLGIWSMHYIGMSAVNLPIDVAYHVPTVLASVLPAILASAVALAVVSEHHPRTSHIVGGSLLMGSGIGAMHYIGMHAMRCDAMHLYDAKVVCLSVAIAVGFSWMAIWIASFLRSYTGKHRWVRLGGAVIMGLGIAAMHYTAMAAVTFTPSPMRYPPENTVHPSTLGVAAVAFTVGIILFGALTTILVDRRVHEQLKKVNEHLQRERDRFDAAAESSMDSFFLCEAVRNEKGEIDDFIFIYLNKNVEKMVAMSRESLLGRKMCEAVPSNRTLGLLERYKQVVITGEPLAHEFSVRHKDVPSTWIRIQAVKVGDGIAITASDITTRKLAEDQILHVAHHDPLTGLLNRSLLRDRIGQAMEQARRSRKSAAVFFIDLDGFKQLNDSMGHAAGDGLLIEVGERLRSVVRSSDSVIRIGGDEFVVVMPGLSAPSDAGRCAYSLLTAVQAPMWIGEMLAPVTCSVGCAVFPGSATEIDDLLAKADQALYTAKSMGKNRFHIFAEGELPASRTRSKAQNEAHGIDIETSIA